MQKWLKYTLKTSNDVLLTKVIGLVLGKSVFLCDANKLDILIIVFCIQFFALGKHQTLKQMFFRPEFSKPLCIKPISLYILTKYHEIR